MLNIHAFLGIIGLTLIGYYVSLIAVTRHRFKRYGIQCGPLKLVVTPAITIFIFVKGIFDISEDLTARQKRHILMISLLAYPVVITLLSAYIQFTGDKRLNFKQVMTDGQFVNEARRMVN